MQLAGGMDYLVHLAEKALRSIKIKYEVLQVITTMEQAQKDGADPIHDTVLLDGVDKPIINNVAVMRTIDVGDTVKGFAEADRIFSMLMGDEVAPRREFIESHAKYAKLDI